MRVLAISGSLRRGSYNSALLAAAAALSPPGVEVAVWRGLDAIPAFDEDAAAVPEAVVALRRALCGADAVLFATPEYNSSVPGALKNALDWVSRPLATNPLRRKRVAVVGASQGLFGAVWAQAELRKILQALGASVDPRELAVAQAHDAFDADGRLRDDRLAATLRAIVADLVPGAAEHAA